MKHKKQATGGFATIFYFMNLEEGFHFMFKSKTKPWDDRELDMMDGFKFINYFAGNIAVDIITSFALVPHSWWTMVVVV